VVKKPLHLGAQDRVVIRLIAARVPEAVVHERRRQARPVARKRGDTSSQAPLTLLAWTLLITNVPHSVWTPATVRRAYSLRWQVELVFKTWKRALHLMPVPTKTLDPTRCYLYGRPLLSVLAYALCPALRTALWRRQRRELSFLKLLRYLQALADRGLQALFESPLSLRHVLSHDCVRVQRVIAKAPRQRRTSAQQLWERLDTQNAFIELTMKLAA
jgi:hypothetical protein